MNELMNVNNKISSIDLVDLINTNRDVDGKRHIRHTTFMRKVPKVLGEEAAHKFVGGYFDANNQERPCYYFPIREAHIMVGSESYKVQIAVYDKMVELGLALQAVQPRELTIEEMAAKVIQARDTTIAKLEFKAMVDEPKVLFADMVMDKGTSMQIGDFAKVLFNEHGINLKVQQLYELLRDHGVIKKKGVKNAPCAEYVYSEWLEVVFTEYPIPNSDGKKGVSQVTMVTPKGQRKLAVSVRKWLTIPPELNVIG